MAFEMSLPHAPRIQALAGDGAETLAADEQQWALYFTVQAALKEQREAEEAAAGDAAPAAGDGEEGGKPAAAAAQPSDPQKALEKLLTARGELDVISDLVTFIEQQQFLAVEGIHRHPPSLEERVRARALRLAASKAQLRGAGALLERGLQALQAQARVDDRFLSDLAQLRRHWKLRRHGGAAGLFYADLALPLRGAAAKGVAQEGAHSNIIMDTNGDACIVEAAAAGGRRRAVRGWRAIHAVLQAKQQLLAWRALQQMIEGQARAPQHEADPDGAVAAVQRMAAAAVACSQAELFRAVAASGGGGGGGGAAGAGAAAMDVDAPAAAGGGGGGDPQQQAAPPSAAAGAAAAAAAAAGAAAAATAPAIPSAIASSAALDIQAVLAQPGFQQQFESRALRLLARLLVGGGSGGGPSGGGGSSLPAAGGGLQNEREDGVLCDVLAWLRHAALRHRASASLARWAAAGQGRSAAPVDTREELAAAWQLAPSGAVVVVQGDRLHVERATPAAAAAELGAGGAAAAAGRGLTKAEFERLLSVL